mmetsp:Transcript_33773/g.71001  ORF Transcript_33773/g.71001 Transcript_33773/m.71001 type:complete len:106 (-) Transcript_33773:546-863(-)
MPPACESSPHGLFMEWSLFVVSIVSSIIQPTLILPSIVLLLFQCQSRLPLPFYAFSLRSQQMNNHSFWYWCVSGSPYFIMSKFIQTDHSTKFLSSIQIKCQPKSV